MGAVQFNGGIWHDMPDQRIDDLRSMLTYRGDEPCYVEIIRNEVGYIVERVGPNDQVSMRYSRPGPKEETYDERVLRIDMRPSD